jgi:hypothetical protein
MSLTKKNLKIIENFNILKTQIKSLLDDKLNKKTHLQNYLYFTIAPVISYTESIIILCKYGKFNAAQALLRTLFEVHINIIYYQIGDIEKKLSIAAKKESDWKRNSVNSIIKLIEKYPNLESSKENSLYNKENLKIITKKINEERLAIINTNKLKENDTELKLFDKAMVCENAKIEEVEPGHFELMYRLPYNLLSTYVHLDAQGIESFIGKDSSGKYFFKEDDSEDLIISQPIAICIDLIENLYKHKVIIGNPPKIINTIKKLIK